MQHAVAARIEKIADIGMLDTLRVMVVSGCGLALLLAGRAFPFTL